MKNLRFSENWGVFAPGSKLATLLLTIIGTVAAMLYVSNAQAQAQDFKWVRTFQQDGRYGYSELAVDRTGNSYAAMLSYGPPTILPNLTNTFPAGSLLVKYGPEGDLLWAKSL